MGLIADEITLVDMGDVSVILVYLYVCRLTPLLIVYALISFWSCFQHWLNPTKKIARQLKGTCTSLIFMGLTYLTPLRLFCV